MNNRYFGNIHDFCKYGLLRLLLGLSSVGGEGKTLFKSLGICWMLTQDDPNKRDDKRDVGLKYLANKGKWGVKEIDEPLFSKFDEWERQGKLRTEGVNLLRPDAGLFGETTFFSAPFPVCIEEREKYFEKMREQFKSEKRDFIFLDPDYGLALGARDWSPGFLPASEVVKCYQDGFSILFYQSQHGAQPDSARLIRGELRRAFSGKLPPVYSIEADKNEAGLVSQHEDAGQISPMFFLLPRPDKRDNVREFLSHFRTHMWQREGKNPVFNIPGRIGVFFDYDDHHCSMEKVRKVHDAIKNGKLIGWSDDLVMESGIFWNGARYRGKRKQNNKPIWAKEPEAVEGLPVVKTDKAKEAVDAEISKRIRICVEHGEVDAVILFASDTDYKLDEVIAGKHNVLFRKGNAIKSFLSEEIMQ